MKTVIATLLFLAAVSLSAQTLSLPAASSTASAGQPLTITPPTAGGGYVACDASFACTYNIYAISGACPQTLPGSAGWKLVTNTAALNFTDTTETPGSQVSWVVEAVGSNGKNGPPSNCVSATVPASPLVPGPPVLAGK